ncbi:MAG: hypothetical protein N4A50_08325 [Vallitalea sp.]|jgi:hypothetical protein|nr:hypothetical protein [Vallitalea sp.]
MRKINNFKIIMVMLAFSLMFYVCIIPNNVQAAGMFAEEINTKGIYQFDCYGDTYDGIMDIKGHVIVSGDRKSVTVYYDVNTNNTNQFGCFFKYYSGGYCKGQKCYVLETEYKPGPLTSSTGYLEDNEWSSTVRGSKTFTFPYPIEKIELGYYMNLYPTNHINDCITIARNYYKTIEIN